MIVGLTGAHGTGKTTLGQEFSKRNPSFTFAATSVSAIMKAHGMDPARDYPIGERIRMQNVILGELDAFYARFEGSTVFDRTPLDAAAYMLADVQRENVGLGDQQAIVRYVERAIEVTNRRFAMLLFVPPVLPLIEGREGKAPPTPAYVEHISQIINGLRADQRLQVRHYLMPREYLALETRVLALERSIGKVIASHLNQVEFMIENGPAIH